MSKICIFNHEGDCCNRDAKQYMCKCKTPCDSIVPLTNFDAIKRMSIESLAEKLASYNHCGFCLLTNTQTCTNTSCKQGIMQYLESEATV